LARINTGFNVDLILEAERKFNLQIRLAAGMGPTTLTIRPGPDQLPFSLAQVVNALGTMLDLDALKGVADLTANKVWGEFFKVSILPELTIVVAPQTSAIQARFMLYSKASRDEADYGIRFSDKLPSFLTIEPDITLYDLIIGYWSGDGLDLKARVKIWPQESELIMPDGRVLDAPAGEAKSEIIKYPFPQPSQGSALFNVNYLGVGQRFGPPPLGLVSDPIKVIFDEMSEDLRSNDPKTILDTLVKKYYQPERNWFFGVDMDVKGWRVQVIFNDPALYGIRITCNVDAFAGFKFEILYQKLGPDLGVYYGAISVPEKFRTINLGAVALKLPTFEIWIYTNGDFKISVGWPLGPNSIGFEVYIFTGGAAFYFAKLRTGFNPRASDPTTYYNPIVAFGLAIKVGLGRSINAGVFRAEVSLTLQGVFQGILAWEGTPPQALLGPRNALKATSDQSIARVPDYYWFSATVGIVGLLQGEVDFKVIKVSINIELSITTGLAFETDYGAIAQITAKIKAEAGIKIVFVTIKFSFSMTLTESFTLMEGPKGVAQIEGPQNPNFQGIVPLESHRFNRPQICYPMSELRAETNFTYLTVQMVPFPAAIYDELGGQSKIVALPMIAPPNVDGTGDYNHLLNRYSAWLLREWGGEKSTWADVLEQLGQGRDAPPDLFRSGLDSFFKNEIRFELKGIDLSVARAVGDEEALLPLPMLPPLSMAAPSLKDPIVFNDYALPDGYVAEVRKYFDDLSLSSLSSNTLDSRVGAQDSEPLSFAQMIFEEYFLMLGRDMARRLSQPPVDEALPTGDLVADVHAIADALAGLATKTVMGGILLPDPAQLDHLVSAPQSVDLLGLYAISHQQIGVDLELPTNDLTFTLAETTSSLAQAIKFVEGESAVSTMPVGATPASPAPIWTDPTLGLTQADLVLSALPGQSPVRRWFASRDSEAVRYASSSARLLMTPPEMMTLAAAGPLSLFAQSKEPSPDQDPVGNLTVLPTLAIAFKIRRVETQTGGQVTDKGEVEPSVLKTVYQISTTDDDTRAKLGRMIKSAAGDNCILELAYVLADGGYQVLPAHDESSQAYLFKTNLSTLSQPPGLYRPLGIEKGYSDVDHATIDEIDAFLQLIWEASVVNSKGFYLHYYDGASKHGLPDDMFDDQGVASFLVLAAAQTQRPLDNYDNALMIPADAEDTIYVAAEDDNGEPVLAYQTTYPAGCVGFQINWDNATSLTQADNDNPSPYSEDTIAALYDMIHYQIQASPGETGFDASLWSLPLSRVKPPGSELNDGTAGIYRQIVPVYRFSKQNSGQIYSQMGQQADIQLRLLDTYGNSLKSAEHTLPLTMLYHDALIAPGQWPGLRTTYRVTTNPADQSAQFILAMEYDPGEVIRSSVHAYLPKSAGSNADKARTQAENAIASYTIIKAQLDDPNVEYSVITPLFGAVRALSANTDLKTQLSVFVGKLIDDLESYLKDNKFPAKRSHEAKFKLEKTHLAEQEETLFAIEFSFKIHRTHFVDTAAAQKQPGVQTQIWTLPADLNVPSGNSAAANPNDGDEPAEVDLRAFANKFEAAFKGYDGAAGFLKLAMPKGDSNSGSDQTTPALWGLKWSASKGLDIQFSDSEAAYFSLTPISTKLDAHDGVDVTIWDKSLRPTHETRSFSAIDIDSWAAHYLSCVDRVLSPALGNAIVKTSASHFTEFVKAKTLLAACLKAGMEPIILPDTQKGMLSFADRHVVEGDLGAARDRFEQQVLDELATGYDAQVVLQIPITVTNQQSSSTSFEPPRMFGGVAASDNTLRLDGESEDAFSVSSTRVSSMPPASGNQYANFIVSASNPSLQAQLNLDLDWEANFIEYKIAKDASEQGYAPSSWLRMIDTDLLSHFKFNLAPVGVPIPSIHYPSVPKLTSQIASQQFKAGQETDYFLWRYDAHINKADRDAKDTLHLKLKLNEPVVLDAKMKVDQSLLGSTGDPVPLFEALAAFEVAWPNLIALLEALGQDSDLGDVDPQALVEIIENLVRRVAVNWAVFRGVPIPPEWDRPRRENLATVTIPSEVSYGYVIDFKHAYDGQKQLIVTSEQNLVWPLINGEAAEANGQQGVRTYEFKEDDGRLTLSWRNLDALNEQTARLHSYLTRNSNLGDAGQTHTNEKLIYRTPETTYQSPVVPRILIDKYPAPEDKTTLAETIEAVLDVLLGMASSIKNERAAKIETRYGYTLISDPREVSSQLSGGASVLLSDGLQVSAAQLDAGDDPVGDIARHMANDINLWRAREALPVTGGQLVQNLTLFAVIDGVNLPILEVDQIIYTVPDSGWWPLQ
jgi:hypothetical protein